MPVDQVPVGDRGLAAGQAVHDDAAGDPLGRGQADAQRGAADGLQHQVGAVAAGQPQHLGGEVRTAGVEDVVGPEGPHGLVLGRCGGGDDRGAVVPGHRHRGLAGRARRGVDQHGLPGGDAAQGPERGQRGRPAHDQAQGLLRGPARRHRQYRDRGYRRVLGEGAAADTDADDRGSGLQAGHRRTPGGDLAGRLDARQVRRARAAQERAVGLGDVDEVDPGRGDLDQDLVRARGRDRRIRDQAQVLRAVQGRLLQGAHGGGEVHGHRLPQRGRSRPGGLQPGRPAGIGKGIGRLAGRPSTRTRRPVPVRRRMRSG